ncbi:GDSL esterase/lipase At2g40250-like [Punica granatum]|uniref:GDSL esterase/lipase At2g40250-like n=1 Tax=Punica granatum TaxID=22663 RepID=A0A6P8CTE3_PUNGR|nr:GDSL esterase/lipase At2g40250-like [Punica granatum]
MASPSATITIIIASVLHLLVGAWASQHGVTAIFAFGDSTLDPGNNNHIGTLFVSNHLPYGRDFPGHIPTGRFTNGRLVTDILISQLGLKQFLPAYLDPALKDEDLLTGASFASAGSGIDDETADLYSLGARKFLVAGMPPTGCLPLQMTADSIFPLFGPHTLQRRCVEQQNRDSQAYNRKLQILISKLSSQMKEARFAYADTYKPLMDMIQNPYREGFGVSAEGCCGTGLVETGPLCLVLTPKCIDPSRYVFWDSIHPTEAAYSRIAAEIIKTTLPKLVS